MLGKGPYVICLHGWGGCTDSFMGLAKSLSKNYTVILVDFYGFGETPEPSVPYTIDNYVTSVLELIRYYKIESTSLVCHSFGGRVGIKFCYKYGYLVDKLVLVDSAGMKPHRSLKYYYAVLKHKLLKRFKISHVSGSPDYRALSPVMKKTFCNIVNEHLEKYAEYIYLPTLLIWGNKDKETPVYMGKRLLHLIKKSRLFIFEKCGHFSYVQKYYLFNRIVRSFLEGESDEVYCGKHSGLFYRHRIITIPDDFSK